MTRGRPSSAGVAYLAVGVSAGRGPSPREHRVFRTVNTARSLPLLRLAQQLGTPWLLPAIAVVGWTTRRPRLALAAGPALPVGKGLEIGTKRMFQRLRPAQADDPELHDDAPETGGSFPSGHAAIAACAAALVDRMFRDPLRRGCTLWGPVAEGASWGKAHSMRLARCPLGHRPSVPPWPPRVRAARNVRRTGMRIASLVTCDAGPPRTAAQDGGWRGA